MKEELFVFMDGERRKLDLDNPSGITLKWVSNLFNDLSKLTCSYSYTFSLPKTDNNIRVLDCVCDIRHNTDLRHAVVDAEFLINGVCLCRNANLHLTEIKEKAFSCVMTWGVLKGMALLKASSIKLNELPSLGQMSWTNNLGGSLTAFLTNEETYVQPFYVAGKPGLPGKPCVPIYRLVQEINKYFGTKFKIGRQLRNSFGALSQSCFNSAAYHGEIHNDDYITYGVIPLTNNEFNGGEYAPGSYMVTERSMTFWILGNGGTYENAYERVWVQGVWSRGKYGNETCFLRLATGQEAIPARQAMVMNVPVFKYDLIYSNIISPLYGSCEDNSFEAFMIKQEARRAYLAEWLYNHSYWEEEVTRTFYFEAHNRFVNSPYGETKDCIGYRCIFEHEVVGSCKLHVKKAAVDARRVSLTQFRWISIGKVSKSNGENNNQYWIRNFDLVSSENVDSWAGLQSYGNSTFDSSTQTYVYTFDFGDTLIARKLDMPSGDSDLLGYFFIPYIPEMESDANGVLKLQEGDLYITDLHIAKIKPKLEFTGFPMTINITKSLPNISVYDFMKALFQMNGAFPTVEADGETISPIFYSNLEKAIMEGEVLDWSSKLIGDKETNSSTKFLPSKAAQHNYFKNANTLYGKSQTELDEEFDEYPLGYGDIQVQDATLSETKDIYKSPFYSPLLSDRRYPSVETGQTTKIWNGAGDYQNSVNPIYGYVLYENSKICLKCFDPFDNIKEFYGYLQRIYDDFVQIKEKLLLNEVELQQIDFGKPIYLSKYNAYFALSTIQRSKDGECTVELIKLPLPEETESGAITADMYGKLEKQEPEFEDVVTVQKAFWSENYPVTHKIGEGEWQEASDYEIIANNDEELYVKIEEIEFEEGEEPSPITIEAVQIVSFSHKDVWDNVVNVGHSNEWKFYIDDVLQSTGNNTVYNGELDSGLEIEVQRENKNHVFKIESKVYDVYHELLGEYESIINVFY